MTSITNAGLKQLTSLTKLTQLSLCGTKISGAEGLATVGPFIGPNMKMLNLTSAESVDDDSLKEVGKYFTNLVRLDCNRNQNISATGLAHLVSLVKLRDLYIISCFAVNDNCIPILGGFVELNNVEFGPPFDGVWRYRAVSDGGISLLIKTINQRKLGMKRELDPSKVFPETLELLVTLQEQIQMYKDAIQNKELVNDEQDDLDDWF